MPLVLREEELALPIELGVAQLIPQQLLPKQSGIAIRNERKPLGANVDIVDVAKGDPALVQVIGECMVRETAIERVKRSS
jgi:hypothetical protein